MKQKIKRFVPTLEDKEWMIEMYNKLGEGSRLITDVAIYQMSNDTLVLREINKKAYELGFDDLSIEKEIEKMRATAAMVEVKFFDARPTRSN
jgi:phosphatidate phosphatase PAH1